MPDFGSDIATTPDLSELFELSSGQTLVGENVFWRLLTPRGTLFYDPNYGYDLRALLNEGIGQVEATAARAAIERECLGEDEVKSARATFVLNAGTLTVSIRLTTADGPFQLVITLGTTGEPVLQILRNLGQ